MNRGKWKPEEVREVLEEFYRCLNAACIINGSMDEVDIDVYTETVSRYIERFIPPAPTSSSRILAAQATVAADGVIARAEKFNE